MKSSSITERNITGKFCVLVATLATFTLIPLYFSSVPIGFASFLSGPAHGWDLRPHTVRGRRCASLRRWTVSHLESQVERSFIFLSSYEEAFIGRRVVRCHGSMYVRAFRSVPSLFPTQLRASNASNVYCFSGCITHYIFQDCLIWRFQLHLLLWI
jgi:hypothetical protein